MLWEAVPCRQPALPCCAGRLTVRPRHGPSRAAPQGHGAAIDLFESILPDLPVGTELHLIGNLMPQHGGYLADLKKVPLWPACVAVVWRPACVAPLLHAVACECSMPGRRRLALHAPLLPRAIRLPQKAAHLPVNFHVGVSSEEIQQLMDVSLVQWHLTGIELASEEDPASEEHFGISVAEGAARGRPCPPTSSQATHARLPPALPAALLLRPDFAAARTTPPSPQPLPLQACPRA